MMPHANCHAVTHWSRGLLGTSETSLAVGSALATSGRQGSLHQSVLETGREGQGRRGREGGGKAGMGGRGRKREEKGCWEMLGKRD